MSTVVELRKYPLGSGSRDEFLARMFLHITHTLCPPLPMQWVANLWARSSCSMMATVPTRRRGCCSPGIAKAMPER
eukprot:881824-Pyramimonas_sp.AAC.1